jgi:hypothetical protein
VTDIIAEIVGRNYEGCVGKVAPECLAKKKICYVKKLREVGHKNT